MKNKFKDECEDIYPAHLLALLEGLEQANRGQFATEAEIEAAFKSFEVCTKIYGRSK